MSKHKIAQIRQTSAELSRQVREKIVGYIVAAQRVFLSWKN
jgi:hypothetical protein